MGFKTFLNITPTITYPSPSSTTQPTSQPSSQSQTTSTSSPTEFILTLPENPLSEFAELPSDALGSSNQRDSTISSNNGGLGRQGDGTFKYARGTAGNGTAIGTMGGQKEGLWFSNVLVGVLRGSLEMVCQMLISLDTRTATRTY